MLAYALSSFDLVLKIFISNNIHDFMETWFTWYLFIEIVYFFITPSYVLVTIHSNSTRIILINQNAQIESISPHECYTKYLGKSILQLNTRFHLQCTDQKVGEKRAKKVNEAISFKRSE